MWENTIQPHRLQMTTWRMRIACCIPKAKNTHWECVILIAFPLQQWLPEGASVLGYTYTAYLVMITRLIIPINLHTVHLTWKQPHSVCYFLCMLHLLRIGLYDVELTNQQSRRGDSCNGACEEFSWKRSRICVGGIFWLMTENGKVHAQDFQTYSGAHSGV